MQDNLKTELKDQFILLQWDKMERKHVTKYEESKILPCLQANRSTCHYFIETSRGHETLVTEMKDSLLFMAIAVARVPAIFHQFSKPQILQGSTKRARCQLHIQWVV